MAAPAHHFHAHASGACQQAPAEGRGSIQGLFQQRFPGPLPAPLHKRVPAALHFVFLHPVGAGHARHDALDRPLGGERVLCAPDEQHREGEAAEGVVPELLLWKGGSTWTWQGQKTSGDIQHTNCD